ncbi:MAG: M48 family metalloprotease [Solirubrobacteraceae bacterium]
MSAPRGRSSRALARTPPDARRLLRDRLGGVGGDSLAMLALALGLETMTAALPIRAGLAFAGCELVLALAGAPGGRWVFAPAVLAPVAWPALALLAPFPSGWWWRRREGGRAPSQRERLAYEDSVAVLQWEAPGALRLPGDWFALDTPELSAAVCGDTLMLTRGLLASEHLTAVLAHELGHLAAGDDRLAAAIGRLMIRAGAAGQRPADGPAIGRGASGQHAADGPAIVWPAPPRLVGRTAVSETAIWVLWLLGCACSLTWQLAQGGIGLRRGAPSLDRGWQAREYEADAFAARLGQGEQLADCLEEHVLIHDGPAPFLWRRASAHPPTELRIDRLRGAIAGERS